MTSPRGGRPRKPTVLKVLHGTDQPCRRVENEPEYADALDAEPPPELNEIGARFFRELRDLTAKVGVATAADKTVLFLAASAYQEYIHCSNFIDQHGSNFNVWLRHEGRLVKENDKPVLNVRRRFPEVAQRADAWRRLIVSLREFGLTPSARSGISANEAAKTQPLDQWANL